MPKDASSPTPSPDIFARLAAPFPPEKVSWRVGNVNQDKTHDSLALLERAIR